MMVSKSLALDLDGLDSAARDAASKAATARDAADQARADEQARRLERIAAWDRAQPAYDRNQLREATAEAQHRLTEAIVADPVWAAVIAVGVAQRREIHRWREADGTGQSPLPSGANRLDFEYLATVADREASTLMEVELAEQAAAREAAADAPS